jgi:hypothetical protein
MPGTDEAVFMYRSTRERMDALEVESQRRGITPRKLLDLIIDEWFAGDLPKPRGNEFPWYLK